MAHSQLWRTGGVTITLGPVIGRGGEGEVHDVVREPHMVAKCYTQRPTQERIDKLLAMVRMSDPVITGLAAWPIDALYDHSPQHAHAQLVGFLMPKVVDHKELHRLSHPMDRFQHFADVGYDFLVHVATNLARAFQVLHERDIVVGDVNESGVMVSSEGTVRLIDCDSMQFTEDGELFGCDVGKPELQPPELLAKGSFRGLVRRVEHDAFGLSVLIFQLLFFGWHPFNVRMLVGDQEPLADNIKKDRFPYGLGFRSREFARPPHALDPAVLPDYVRDLFERAFVRGRPRPRAEEWVEALTCFVSESRACPRFGTHAFHASLPTCPLCDLDERLGFPILPHIALDAAQLRELWGMVKRAYYDLNAPVEVHDDEPPPPPAPIPTEVRAHAHKAVLLTRVQLALLVVFGALAVLEPMLALGALVIVPLEIVRVVSRPPATIAALKTRRALAHAMASAEAGIAARGDHAVQLNYEAAHAAYDRIVHFEAIRQRAVGTLQDRFFPAQLQRHLARMRLDPGVIPGLGPKKVALLRKHGIASAADLMHGFERPDGISAELEAALERWLNYQQSQFIPDLDDPGYQRQIAQIQATLDLDLVQCVERLKLSAQWLGEQLPADAARRADAVTAWREASRAARVHAPLGRWARARWSLPREPT